MSWINSESFFCMRVDEFDCFASKVCKEITWKKMTQNWTILKLMQTYQPRHLQIKWKGFCTLTIDMIHFMKGIIKKIANWIVFSSLTSCLRIIKITFNTLEKLIFRSAAIFHGILDLLFNLKFWLLTSNWHFRLYSLAALNHFMIQDFVVALDVLHYD